MVVTCESCILGAPCIAHRLLYNFGNESSKIQEFSEPCLLFGLLCFVVILGLIL